MTNFVFIYHNGGDMGDLPMEEVTAAWKTWFGQLGDTLIDGGNPFNDGAQAVTKDSVSAVGNSPASGYSIVKADNMATALELAKSCPMLEHSSTGSVEVYETMPM
ncbi:MAG TPA: hypothetical protein VLE74_00870 [Candidatus Saccharimonadales bacterium]|nr:hypothetical protein [Candidatus Saccharimonadales bacterium]